MKRIIPFLMILSLFLTGCGLFHDTYVYEDDYILPIGKDSAAEGSISVLNLSELREAIRRTVSTGDHSRVVIFDSRYTGNPAEDLASACWQVRTEDALCAYCVENIAYELSQIVSVKEARISISYSTGALPVREIISMPYATGLNERIADAIQSGCQRLAILINRSTLTAEDMTARFSEVYRKKPGLAPVEPDCSVTLFSGSGTQRLYEIILDPGMEKEEFIKRKEALDHVVLDVAEDASDFERAVAAAQFLKDRCHLEGESSVYAALVGGSANPEGISLGYVELCRRLGIECIVVYGQQNWTDHCWNIIRIDGQYYHMDLFAGEGDGWFKTDEDFWGHYRWNVNDYPKCVRFKDDESSSEDVKAGSPDELEDETSSYLQESPDLQAPENSVYPEPDGSGFQPEQDKALTDPASIQPDRGFQTEPWTDQEKTDAD